MAIHGERSCGHRGGRWTPRNKTILSSNRPSHSCYICLYLRHLRHLRIVSHYILLVHGERPLGHGVGVEATVDCFFAGLSELASPIFVAQQGGKLVG